MLIKELKQTLPGVYELTPDAGSAFFLRIEYLSLVTEDRLIPFGYGRLDILPEDFAEAKEGDPGFFTLEEEFDLKNAALIYSVELAAMSYLSRAEQSKSGLRQKLIKKGMDKKAVERALSYLEEVHYLDDRRFAGAWLRTRSIDHAEGRIRLAAELAARGIDRNASKLALDEFFSENDEMEICIRAYKKLAKVKKDEKKLHDSLIRAGFTEKQLKNLKTVKNL